MVHRLEAAYWEQIDFIYLDQFDSANADIMRHYSLRGRPIFVLLEPDGTEVARWYGAWSENEIREKLDSALTGA